MFTRWLSCFAALLPLSCRPGPVGPPPQLDPVVAEAPPQADVVAHLGPAGPPPVRLGTVQPSAPPGVVELGPEGVADTYGSLFVRFTRPMQMAVEGPAAPKFEVVPPVAGYVRWVSPYRVVFDPEEGLAIATAFRVQVTGALVTAAGEPMALDASFSFETPRPVPTVEPVERPWEHADDSDARHWNTAFVVSADGRLNTSRLRAHVHAVARSLDGAGTPRAVPVVVRPATPRDYREIYWLPERAILVRPRRHWPAGSEIEVVVDKGLRLGGPLPIGRAVSATILTQPGLTVEFACGVEYDDGCGPSPVYLTFSNEISKDKLRQIRVTPRPPGFRRALRYDDVTAREVVLEGKFAMGTTYTITVDPELADIYGQTAVGVTRRKIAFVSPPPMVRLMGSHGTLAATHKRTVGLETRWVERVRIRAAVLEDQQLLSQFTRDAEDLRIPPAPRVLYDDTLDLEIDGELGWGSYAIDLGAIASGERRPVLVEVTPTALMAEAVDRPPPVVQRAIYQQTDLGAVSLVSPARSFTRVTSLDTGKVLPGVQAELYRGTKTIAAPHLASLGAAAGDGIVELPKSTALPKRGLVLLHTDEDRYVASVGKLAPLRRWRSWGRGAAYVDRERLLSTLVTERPLYRPGEDVYVVGWSALSTNHSHVGLQPLPVGTPVVLSLLDRDGDPVATRTVATKASGKYWGKLAVPEKGSLGRYRVKAKIGDDEFGTSVRVKDFRTPTFAVKVSGDRGDLVVGESVDVALAASYYFGGEVPIQQLTRHVQCTLRHYRPPHVGTQWRLGRLGHREVPSRIEGDRGVVSLTPEQAQSGRARITANTDLLTGVAPYRCLMSLAVRDISMQDVGAEQSWWVHPDAYVAIAPPSARVREDDRFVVSVRTVDFAGTRRTDPVSVTIVHHKWVEIGGRWRMEPQPARTCALTTTARGVDTGCAVSRARKGRYTFKASRLAGPEPRAVASGSLWVGRKTRYRPVPSSPVFSLEIDPPRPEPGETVVLRLSAPYATGDGIVALQHGGVRRVEPFSLVDGKATLEMVVDQSWVPRLSVDAMVSVASTPSTIARLDKVSGTVEVRAHGRALTVAVDAPQSASPNETIEIGLQVRDAAGRPTAANVSVWAVDEAVLSLQEPTIPDLVAAFIVDRGPRTAVYDEFDGMLRPYRRRTDPYDENWDLGSIGLGGSGGGRGYGGGSAGGTARGPSAARERFETTPIFIGDVALPASGKGTVRGRLPENLTTFRITAIASARLGDSEATGRFGHGESRTRLTTPLVLRVITPRILRPDDEAEFAAVVDNLGGPAGTVVVTLALQGEEGTLVSGGALRQSAAIAAGGQVRVPFPVRARAQGKASVQMRVELSPTDPALPHLYDAMRVEVPVNVERTLVRRSAVYGSVADAGSIAVQVDAPDDVTAGTGLVDVRLDTSLLDGLQDVVGDLVDYPYGCVEQTSSALVPLVALGELSRSYPLGIEDVSRYVSAGVARLRSMQTASGGLGYWPRSDSPHVYGTAYALWVLEQLRQAGYPVSAQLRRTMGRYLRAEVSRWARREASTPHDDVPIAMALHALSFGNALPAGAVDKLVDAAPTLPVFAQAVTAMMLHRVDPTDDRVDDLIVALESRLESTAGGATVRGGGSLFAQYFDSTTRTHAMVLFALSTVRPGHAAIEPLARGLMALRQAGRLRNTQENAYALLGLARYAREFEAQVPDVRVDAWIGARRVVSRAVAGERFASARGERPLDSLTGPMGSRVTVRRSEGQGRVYYRVAMAWTPQHAQDERVAAGIGVETVLRDADGEVREGDVIAPGTLLALDVTVTTDANVDYVAIDIPLPAGLEAVDRSFGKGRRAMVLSGARGWWASHEEIRRDRALVFADRLRAGSHVHTVYLRATTPGSYDMPPTVAQSMYFPEIVGHTARRRIVVGRRAP